VRFGVHAVNFDQFSSRELITGLARTAEELRYEVVWVADHVVMPENLRQVHPYTGTAQFTTQTVENAYEALITLAYLAGITDTVQLLVSALVLPYRQPVLTAKMLATIDQLSDGRLVVGAGVGWLADEFAALDADYAARGKVSDEILQVYRQLWAEELPQFHGTHYDFQPLRFLPKPVQRPNPPIWIGGHSRPALRRAAQYGDGWHATRQPVETMRELVGQLAEQCRRFDRDVRDLTLSMKCNLRLDQPATLEADLAGTAAEVAEQIRQYEQLGIELIILDVRPHESLDQQVHTLKRFSHEVRPLLDQSSG
jgi:probable F420-dependent oxidoreductase